MKKSTFNSAGRRDLNAMLASPLVTIDPQIIAPLLESLESGVAGIEAIVSDAAAGLVQHCYCSQRSKSPGNDIQDAKSGTSAGTAASAPLCPLGRTRFG